MARRPSGYACPLPGFAISFKRTAPAVQRCKNELRRCSYGKNELRRCSYGRDRRPLRYANDGSQSFTTHLIGSSLGGAQGIHAADVDGDADVDVVAAAWHTGDVLWFANDGAESFDQRDIDDSLSYAQFVLALDFNGDSDVPRRVASNHARWSGPSRYLLDMLDIF